MHLLDLAACQVDVRAVVPGCQVDPNAMSKRTFWDGIKVVSADAADSFLAWAGHSCEASPTAPDSSSSSSPRRHRSHSHLAAALASPFTRIANQLSALARVVVSGAVGGEEDSSTFMAALTVSDDADSEADPAADELVAESSLFGEVALCRSRVK